MTINIFNDFDKIQSAQSQEDVIFQPGTFRVSMATLHHGKPRNEHPIGDFIQRIFLFEDMEKFGLTGWIDMLDTYNLVRNSLILGEELLYLKFEIKYIRNSNYNIKNYISNIIYLNIIIFQI